MKLNLIALIIFFLGINTVIGQELGQDNPPSSKILVGFRVGATFNTFTNTPLILANEKKVLNIGLHAGVVVKGDISDHLSLQGEVLINERGRATRSRSTNLSQRLSSKIYYVDMPLIVKYYFGKRQARFFTGTGPQIGVGFKQRELSKVKLNNQTERNSTSLDWPDNVNRLAVLWLIDLGMNIQFENGKQLEVGLRPQFGLNNFNKSVVNINSKPLGFMLTTVYLLGK